MCWKILAIFKTNLRLFGIVVRAVKKKNTVKCQTISDSQGLGLIIQIEKMVAVEIDLTWNINNLSELIWCHWLLGIRKRKVDISEKVEKVLNVNVFIRKAHRLS